MLAARISRHGGPDALELAQVPVPAPGAGQVLVEVTAVALNNTDLWTREGAYGAPGDPEARSGWRGPIDFPRVQGADIAGTVAGTGEGVDPGLTGERVLVDPAIYDGDGNDANPVGLLGSERDGGYAWYVLAGAARVHRVGDSPLSDTELACFPTAYGTALGMLERGGVRAGETVAVTGASGGVGLALVQLAAADAVREAGAEHVLDRGGGDPWQHIAGVAPEGLDAVLDVVAGTGLTEGLESLRDGGRWIVAGALGGADPHLDVRRLYTRNLVLVGSSMHTPAHFRTLVEIARSGDVRPVVAATFGLGDVHRAQAELATRRHIGKLVLTVR
ncbi:zinc-binding dehydrogenase [Nocardiopsis salina]